MDSQWIQINSPKAKQNKIKTHTYTIYGNLFIQISNTNQG
jgi:hypothetical protein